MSNEIAVTQRCCEWMALVKMTEMLVACPFEMTKLLDAVEAGSLEGALTNIYNEMPEGLICNTSACVLFSMRQVEVLAKVVGWFDDQLMHYSEKLMKQDLTTFGTKWEQTGLIKRNLTLYAKVTNTD